MREVEFRILNRQIIVPVAIADPHDPMKMERADALIDTGASVTCIARDIAERLNLPPRGKQTIANANGLNVVRTFLANIGLYPSQRADSVAMPFMLDDAFMVFEFTPTPKFQVLLGMDVLQNCQFGFGRNGMGTIGF